MKLSKLHLFSFRNIDILDWRPHPNTNLLIGANAQGKTNLLESLFLLGTTKTYRGGDEELIFHGRDQALVRGEVETENGPERELEVALVRGQGKELRLNQKRIHRHSQMLGQFCVVLFRPEDLELVKAGPQARRNYLDLEISQASPTYLIHLQRFHRVLKQRNAALKMQIEGRAPREAVEAFDEPLIESGCEILLFRLRAMQQLIVLAAQAQAGIAGFDEALSLSYQSSLFEDGPAPSQPSPEEMAGRFRHALEARAREELARGITLVGPHRDDLEISIHGRSARHFASQGQQRSAALALKLAELRFLRQNLGENPVLLLDDVLSELDPSRQANLLAALDSGVQTFITSTHALDLPGGVGQILEVREGKFKDATAHSSGVR
jgi:DNA replication and repair protein RecF